MKTKVMILACLFAVPAGHLSAQQQTDPEQKTTVKTQGDSIIIRKGKGDMRIKVYEEQLEEGEKKEVQIFEGVYLEKVDADKRTFLDALPFIPQKKGIIRTIRTAREYSSASAGCQTISCHSVQAKRQTSICQNPGSSASIYCPSITTSRRLRTGEST